MSDWQVQLDVGAQTARKQSHYVISADASANMIPHFQPPILPQEARPLEHETRHLQVQEVQTRTFFPGTRSSTEAA
jgi:hypothetical protein